MSEPSRRLAQSVHARLLRLAQSRRIDPNLALSRFAAERFLFRLAASPHAQQFVLKGASLLQVWLGELGRPTRDVDLLGFGDLGPQDLKGVFCELCQLEVEQDGVEFHPSSIQVERIRPTDRYGGQRVSLLGHLGGARLFVQVDVGVGDAVRPQPGWLDYPTLLPFPAPRLLAYRPETLIAEKFHAMVEHGARNSRMRDFYDVVALATNLSFGAADLLDAIHATFERRRTPWPTTLPLALTPAFAGIAGKEAQWRAFLSRLRALDPPPRLVETVERLAGFLGPVLLSASEARLSQAWWPPGGPWAEGS